MRYVSQRPFKEQANGYNQRSLPAIGWRYI